MKKPASIGMKDVGTQKARGHWMLEKQHITKYLRILFSLGSILLVTGIANGAESDKTSETQSYAMSETELQAQIMGFVDRFSAIMTSQFRQSDALSKTRKSRYDLQSMITYALYNAYIIAGDSDPDIALLDMLCMVSLGRLVFEEEGQKLYGSAAKPIIKGFRVAEREIHKIAAGVLRKGQLDKVMSNIRFWRNNNPEIIFFQFIRFNNIIGQRLKSKGTDAQEPEGILDTVEFATEQVEELRLLAERGIYLATRLPQFWVAFGELGMSKLFENPEMKEALANFTLLSQLPKRLTTAAEKLSDQIAVERQTVVNQVLEAIPKERQMAIDQIVGAISAERKAAVDDILNKAEKQSEALVDYTMRWLIALIVISFFVYIVAKVILRLVPTRSSA